MTHDQAIKLSQALAEAGFSHVIAVGVYDNMSQRVQARVDVQWPRRHVGSVAEAVAALDALAKAHELELHTALMGEGLTFSTRAELDHQAGIFGLAGKAGIFGKAGSDSGR